MNRQYLFTFNFEKYTQKSYIINFLKERKIDFFESKFGILYADLFGIDTYYKLEAIHICNDTFEVYYYPEQTEERGLPRIYPLVEKALKIDTPSHKVKVTFENGDSLTTTINGCKDEIEEYYYNNVFNMGAGCDDDMQKVVKVEFLI